MPELSATAEPSIGLPAMTAHERERARNLRGYYLPAEFVHALKRREVDSADLNQQYDHYRSGSRGWYHPRGSLWQRFTDLVESASGDSISQCGECSDVTWDYDMEVVNDGDIRACPPCFNNYSYCAECDGWFHTYDAGDHAHDDDDDRTGSTCEIPLSRQRFALKLADGTTLDSDTRRAVTVEPTIGSSARHEIYNALYAANPLATTSYYDETPTQQMEKQRWQEASDSWYYAMNEEPVWQTPAGNLTKRLRKFFLQRELKLSNELVERIGNIARAAMARSVSFDLVLTRKLNGSADEYNNDGSCWWGSYSSARCVLKQNGGMALMLYHGDDLAGRAWVLPIKRSALDYGPRWLATDNLNDATAYLVFNSYVDDDGGKLPVRLLSEMLGFQSKSIGFSAEYMYVNGDRAVMVAPQDVLDTALDNSWCIELNFSLTCTCPIRASV
jgi:hypothetical protein